MTEIEKKRKKNGKKEEKQTKIKERQNVYLYLKGTKKRVKISKLRKHRKKPRMKIN